MRMFRCLPAPHARMSADARPQGTAASEEPVTQGSWGALRARCGPPKWRAGLQAALVLLLREGRALRHCPPSRAQTGACKSQRLRYTRRHCRRAVSNDARRLHALGVQRATHRTPGDGGGDSEAHALLAAAMDDATQAFEMHARVSLAVGPAMCLMTFAAAQGVGEPAAARVGPLQGRRLKGAMLTAPKRRDTYGASRTR